MGLKNVLIISEDKSDHLVLSAALDRALPQRFNVTTATALDRPLDALMDSDNDAVILAQAPETDYLLRLAQKQEVSIPIIVVLSESSEATIARLRSYGARDFLVRGGIQDELLHRILDYSIELGKAQQQIKALSNRDALTGALNRTGFRAHVERAVERSDRYKFNTALLCVNIDNFSHINDHYGEGAGDQAIKMLYRRLANKKRNTDSVARIGGDEFAIVLEDVKDEASVRMIADKMMEAAAQPMMINEQQVAIEVSIGASMCPMHGSKFEDLVEAARSAMSQAKSVQGNKYFQYTDTLSFGDRSSSYNLAAELRHAVRHDEFELYYQPRVDLATEQVVGLEALLRWEHPQRGLVRPEEFLPLCESMGLMRHLGYRVIEKACAAVNWLDEQRLTEIDVAVNVSFSQFADEKFTEVVNDIVARAEIPPYRLEFELTESTVLKSPADTKVRMDELRHQGHAFSLDDFGTGFSQLSHMTALPITALKIDRSFVQEVAKDRHQQAVCMMIIDMAQRLELVVIAEGTESQEQVRFLKSVNCQQVQGFFYSPAVPLEQIPRFVEEQRNSDPSRLSS